MNKIFPKKELNIVCNEYAKFVEPRVRQRLNILIGFLLLREGQTIDLDSDHFSHNGVNYSIGIDPNEKKGIINSFLSKNGNSDRITVSSGKLQLPNLADGTIYKDGITANTLDSIRFIELSTELKDIIGKPINIAPGFFLDRSKTYCQSLSKNEKLILKEIFPYHLFFQDKDHTWFYAAKLAEQLNTPVCPYCNREYITSVRTRKGKKVIGPTFDHFLSQKDYPFLKLSFYNLVPSCTTCNSRLKNQIEFDFDHFLYPFKESYECQAIFKLRLNNQDVKTRIDDSAIIRENKLSIRIKTTPSDNPKLHGPKPLNQKKGNLNVFKTEKIYNDSHKDVAFDILERFQRVPQSHIESTYKILKAQGKSHPEIYRFYFGNYIEEEDFNKRPLARMTRDIVKQLEDVYKTGILIK